MFKCMPFKSCTKQVEYIDKTHTTLMNVPDDVMRYSRTLEELFLDANQISELPKNFFRLTQLRKVGLSDNNISVIPPEIGNLVNLAELDCSRNEIDTIPENIKFCKQLQVVDFTCNPLNCIPDGFCQLKGLTHVTLNDVSLVDLPTDFGNLTNLVQLELRDNNLSLLPPSFGKLHKLESLDLGNNEMDTLSDSIGSLVSLRELWLDGNDLSELPESISSLERLQQLDVSENKLDVLTEKVGELRALTDLVLSQNCLECLPDSIGRLGSLAILKVDQNRLLELTPHLGNCSAIQELMLQENLLSDLPVSLGNLTQLTNFNVDRNRLSDLPPQMGNLLKMTVFAARDNRIWRIPPEFGNLKNLKVFDVRGNRLRNLPLSVLQLTQLKALWLAENQSQPMPKLQTDVDDDSGDKVVTCFLLPQDDYHTQSMENLLRGSVMTTDSGAQYPSTEHESEKVRFKGDFDPNEESGGQLVRHSTPFPRDLRNKHPKLAAKAIDGHVIHSDHHKKGKPEPFMPSRDRDVKYDDDNDEPPIIKIRKPVEPRRESYQMRESIPDFPNPVFNQPRPVKEPEARSLTPISATPPKPQTPPPDTPRVDIQTAVETTPPAVLDTQTVPTVQVDEPSDVREQNESVSSEEEEPVIREKRVGFSAESEDLESRLRRRDTPHHLKNKRVSDQPDAEEMVKRILAQKMKETESPAPAAEPPVEERIELEIHREPGQGLGISIAGGKGSVPYKDGDESVFISRVTTDGPAELAGLRVGDKVLQVDESDLEQAGHFDAVAVLKSCGTDIKVVISRQPQSPGRDALNTSHEADSRRPSNHVTVEPNMRVKNETLETTLYRDNGGLGFSISGGRNEATAAIPASDETVYISKIVEGGPADIDGRLLVGDRIVSINGSAVTSASHDEVVSLLHQAEHSVTLVVERDTLLLDSNHTGANHVNQVTNENTEPIEKPVTKKIETSVVETESAPGPREVAEIPARPEEVNVRITTPQEPAEVTSERTPVPAPRRPSIENLVEAVKAEENEKYPTETVVIEKAGGPLGLSVVGGSDHCSHPFGRDEPGLFISKLVPGGAAERCGRLRCGDRILSVNEYDVTNCTHQQSVSALVNSPQTVTLRVRHDPPPPNMQKLSLTKAANEKLGLSIVGGVRGHPANPDDPTDEGIFISRVTPDSAAARDTRLQAGQRIMEVDGVSLLGATHDSAVETLRASGDNVQIVVCDGYIPTDETAAPDVIVNTWTRDKDPIDAMERERKAASQHLEDVAESVVKSIAETQHAEIQAKHPSPTPSPAATVRSPVASTPPQTTTPPPVPSPQAPSVLAVSTPPPPTPMEPVPPVDAVQTPPRPELIRPDSGSPRLPQVDKASPAVIESPPRATEDGPSKDSVLKASPVPYPSTSPPPEKLASSSTEKITIDVEHGTNHHSRHSAVSPSLVTAPIPYSPPKPTPRTSSSDNLADNQESSEQKTTPKLNSFCPTTASTQPYRSLYTSGLPRPYGANRSSYSTQYTPWYERNKPSATSSQTTTTSATSAQTAADTSHTDTRPATAPKPVSGSSSITASRLYQSRFSYKPDPKPDPITADNKPEVTSPTSPVDPVAASRIPSARTQKPANTAAPPPAPTEQEQRSYSDKRKFFEQEIEAQTEVSAKVGPARPKASLRNDTPDSTINSHTSAASSSIPIRTKKAENRQNKSSPSQESNLSPAQQRAREAERRAEWRKARLQSMEVDALQAQAVLSQQTHNK